MADKMRTDAKLPSQSLPTAEIPDLRKKEKDRKKSGAAWGSGKAANSFAGARGTASAIGTAGAEGAVEVAGAASKAGVSGFFANLLARFGSLLAELTSTLLGKAVAMAVVALMVGGIGTFAYKMMAGSQSAKAAPELGDISSSIKVAHDTDNTRLQYAGKAADGQLDWANKPIAPEDDKAAAPKDEVAKNGEAAPAAVPVGPTAGGKRSLKPVLPEAYPTCRAAMRAPLAAGAWAAQVCRRWQARTARSVSSGPLVFTSGKGGKLAPKNIMGALGNSLVHLSANPSKSLALLRGMASRYNGAMHAGGTSATETSADAASAQFDSSELTEPLRRLRQQTSPAAAIPAAAVAAVAAAARLAIQAIPALLRIAI